MACHPEQPFTAEQEARLREIAREEIEAAVARKRLERPVLQMAIEDGCFIGFQTASKALPESQSSDPSELGGC
jgi:hypothetical protein